MIENQIAMDLVKKVDEIYRQVDNLSKSQATVQQQVGELYTAFKGNELGQTGMVERVLELEKKYSQLSMFKAKAVGFAIGVGAIAGIVVDFVRHKLNL
jgi:1-aminocyclopropane-1-carboxylate deaminase/D-cysteine desulfhydrase-like pyridoxal-dependent ACC family enzyme